MALVTVIDHFNIHTSRLDETVSFFEDVLGLENRPADRPDFPVPGAWLWVGDNPFVHLIEIENDKGPAQGSFDHVAFATDDFDGLLARLTTHEVEHSVANQPQTGLRQVFFSEPNGVQLEVTCPA